MPINIITASGLCCLINYRRAIVQDFIIIYHVDDDKREVQVIAAFHGKQNYAAYL